MISTLGVVKDGYTWHEPVRRRRWWGSTLKPVTHPILDFTIDGAPLRDLEGTVEEAGGGERSITMLIDDFPHEAVSQIDHLVGTTPPDVSGGRVALLICPCFDPGCGVLSAQLVTGSGTVQWRDLGWQRPSESLILIQPTTTFTFDRRQYESVLLDLRARSSALAER